MEGGKRKCLAIAAMVLAALNHHVVLERTNEKHIGICPISGARFTYEADDDEMSCKKVLKIRMDGTMVEEEDWQIKSIDGEGG